MVFRTGAIQSPVDSPEAHRTPAGRRYGPSSET